MKSGRERALLLAYEFSLPFFVWFWFVNLTHGLLTLCSAARILGPVTFRCHQLPLHGKLFAPSAPRQGDEGTPSLEAAKGKGVAEGKGGLRRVDQAKRLKDLVMVTIWVQQHEML